VELPDFTLTVRSPSRARLPRPATVVVPFLKRKAVAPRCVKQRDMPPGGGPLLAPSPAANRTPTQPRLAHGSPTPVALSMRVCNRNPMSGPRANHSAAKPSTYSAVGRPSIDPEVLLRLFCWWAICTESPVKDACWTRCVCIWRTAGSAGLDSSERFPITQPSPRAGMADFAVQGSSWKFYFKSLSDGQCQ
jgi:hypothetical protein